MIQPIQYYFFAFLVAVAVELTSNVACFTTQYVQTCLATNQVNSNSISAINTAGGKRGKQGKLLLLLLNCW